MNIIKKFNETIFKNHEDDAAMVSSGKLGMGYSKVLRFLAAAGIFYGASEVLYAINVIWLHWPGIAMLVLVGALSVMFLCLIMIIIRSWSAVQSVIWFGMAMMVLTQLFVSLRWVGGMQMELQMLIVTPLVLFVAIGVFYYIPDYYKWSRRALCWWIIGTQVVFIILTCVRWYYLNYVIDQFEPAIPYAENSVHYMRINIWMKKIYVLGNGLTMLFISIYLYYVACKQNK